MATTEKGLGGRIAPPRFLAFLAAFAVGVWLGVDLLGWRRGIMAGFDGAAILFIAISLPLVGSPADTVRRAARRNDANRALLLVITAIVMVAVLVSVASELQQKGAPQPTTVALIIGTLVLCWVFTNWMYALHYAHLYYDGDDDGRDTRGLAFPKTDEPDYWDFVYFGFCLGMTFQTSDVDIENGRMRRVVTGHCLAAFVFNLGVLAFTINVLGGG